jgi:hypothetical protein
MIYYILHNFLPETETFKDGKRNCFTFLFGSVCYSVVYAVLKNVQLMYGIVIDACITAFLLILGGDVLTMAYIYKNYYGRNIIHEIGAEREQKDWKYNDETHKYTRTTEAEKIARKLQETKDKIVMQEIYNKELSELKAKIESMKKTELILRNKEKVRAAMFIQRWWRKKLYLAPNGIFYLKSLSSFNELKNIDIKI